MKERLIISFIRSYRKGEIDTDWMETFLDSSDDHDFPFLFSQVMDYLTPEQIKPNLIELTYTDQEDLFLSFCQWDRQHDIDEFIQSTWLDFERYRNLAVFLFEFGYWVDAIMLEEAIISSMEISKLLHSSLDRMITEFTNEMLADGLTIPEIASMINVIEAQYPFIMESCDSHIYNLNNPTFFDDPTLLDKFIQKRDSITATCRVLWPDL